MKLGIASAPLGRRRVSTKFRVRRRDERIDELRTEAERTPMLPWAPPMVIRVRALGRST